MNLMVSRNVDYSVGEEIKSPHTGFQNITMFYQKDADEF